MARLAAPPRSSCAAAEDVGQLIEIRQAWAQFQLEEIHLRSAGSEEIEAPLELYRVAESQRAAPLPQQRGHALVPQHRSQLESRSEARKVHGVDAVIAERTRRTQGAGIDVLLEHAGEVLRRNAQRPRAEKAFRVRGQADLGAAAADGEVAPPALDDHMIVAQQRPARRGEPQRDGRFPDAAIADEQMHPPAQLHRSGMEEDAAKVK